MRIGELKAIYSGNPIQISKRKVFLEIIYEMEVEPSILTPISRQGQLTLKYIRHVWYITTDLNQQLIFMSPKVRNLNEGPITLGLNFQHTLIDGKWEMFNDGNKLSPQNTSVNFDLSSKCIYAVAVNLGKCAQTDSRNWI